MKCKILLSIFCLIALTSMSYAKQLTQEEKEFYNKLKNCTPMENPPFTIAGFENDNCKVLMSIKNSPDSKAPEHVFTYKYPKKILKEMVNDAINLSKSDFNAKWIPREQEFCESVRQGDKIFYFK